MNIAVVSQNRSINSSVGSMDNANDMKSKGIQNEISSARQQLQKLSNSRELTDEEKSKKRQDYQNKIKELNRELRQHQVELRKSQTEDKRKENIKENLGGKAAGPDSKTEKTAEEKKIADNDKVAAKNAVADNRPADGRKKADNKKSDDKKEKPMVTLDKKGSLVKAKTAVDQSEAERRTDITIKGLERTMQGEIRQDSMRGENTDKKEESLNNMEQKASAANAMNQAAMQRYNSGKIFESVNFVV